MLSSKKLNCVVHITFIIMMILVLGPMICLLTISLSDAVGIREFGYSFIPETWSISAYAVLLSDMWPLAKAMLLTIVSAVVSTGLSIVLCGMAAYAWSSPNFAYQKAMSLFILIPMIIHPGLIARYIIEANVLGLADNILIYFVTGLCASWRILLFKTFIKSIPVSLMEAARIDGASEFRTFKSIVIPLSKSILAAEFCKSILGKWNDFSTPLYYITNPNYYNIQYFLQNILREATFLNGLYKDNPAYGGELFPTETMPYAVAVIALVPILITFPYMQKYFSKGIAVGSVKG